ncbi:PAS domain-containing protein [Streptomyces sp. BE20]|uniref:response regulator n=1 Tax=Streptomyces sp. BE20 TaxID=3002525 RepID=UPI002E75C5C9|nr:PAS domain-containing protein [Streptomyces sp. BE20]MEE1828427.1 PAS domain-containing protein [Streptomyces sp. BE20]
MSSRPIRGAARLAAILDALPDALLLVNSNGTVVDANNAAVHALQTPGTSLVGMGVLDLLPEFDPSRIPGSMRPAAREDDALDRPVRMTARRTDGSTFPVEVSGNDFADDGTGDSRGYALSPLAPYDPYREGSRSSDLLLLLVRDLSSRLGVEAELRRQHKQTEMILRAAAEGVLGVDLEGRCVLVNPAAAHILEYRASELGGRELHPLIQHSRADGTPLALEESALLDTLTSGRKHRVRGTVLWRKDGRPVTVDLTTAPVRDGDQLVGAVMTFTDRSRELALVARNEHLTAVLESELGGALTALHRRIDTLAADPAGQLWPEANWTLRRLADECRRFGKLIDGVLAHQRSEAGEWSTGAGAAGNGPPGFDGPGSSTEGKPDDKAGKKAAERVPVALDKVVRRAVEHAGELVGAGRVRFSVHAAAVEVIADEQRLAQALAHLVADVSGVGLSLDAEPALPSPGLTAPGLNPASGTALPAGGGDAPMVVLAAAQRGEVARVEIRGPGRGGSPVHLPIARAVVERHGGVLQPHELPGRAGTTYVVELPLDPAAAKAAAERAGAEGRSDRPKESDSAVLPDLPGIPELPTARSEEPTGAPAAEPAAGSEGGPAGPAGATGPSDPSTASVPSGSTGPAGPAGLSGPERAAAEGVPAEEPTAERRGRRGRPAVEEAPLDPAADRPSPGHASGPSDRSADPSADPSVNHGAAPGGPQAAPGPVDPAVPADQWPNAPARIERAVPEQWNGTGNDPAYGRQGLGGPAGPESDPWGKDDGRSGTAYAVPVEAGHLDQRAEHNAEHNAGQHPERQDGPRGDGGPVRDTGGDAGHRGPFALGPGTGAAEAGADGAPTAATAPEGDTGQEPKPSRRRRALPGAEDSSGGFALPGVTDSPLYPGLEHALPAGPAPAQPEPAAAPTGRRRRLAVPPGPGAETPGTPDGAPPAPSALPALPSASPSGPSAPGDQREDSPLPVGTGLGELTPPRPLGAPGATPLGPVAIAPDAPQPVAANRPAPRVMAELPAAPTAQDEAAYTSMPAPGADGGPRRLLVWPEPDPATRQALQDRGYRPVIVRSREEVDAQVSGFPAALFVDPLTGPITRTALQSLRTAALNSRVPVVVTAGLGQATRDAAYGADPAVLLRALAPRDGENHAPRVLLVEGDPDIAAAMIGSLERRGMHVEHAVDENDAVARASSVQPNLVVMDLFQIRRRRVGLLDWLRTNDRLHRTPLVVYTSVDLDPRELPRLRTGETVLFLAERSTSDDVQSRIVDLLGRIGAMGEAGVAAAG